MPDMFDAPSVADTQAEQPDLSAQDKPLADWRTMLDVGYRESPTFTKYKSINDLAKSHQHLSTLVGKNKIPIPGEDGKPEDWDLVFNSLGRPQTADEYQLPEFQVPEGFPEVPKEVKAEYKKIAHELGLLPAQVAKLYEWDMKNSIAKFQQMNEQRDIELGKAEANLRREWGRAYEQNIVQARRILEKFGDDNVRSLIEDGLGNNPHFIKFLANLGKQMSEDGIRGVPTRATMTPDEAQRKIAEIKGNPAHPYYQREHPEHIYALEMMKDLHTAAFPD